MADQSDQRQVRGFGDTNFVLLARDAVAGPRPHAALPEAEFTFDAQGEHEPRWRVTGFEASEGLSRVYECAVDVANPSLAVNPDALLGRYAVLRVARPAAQRRFYGLVRRVEHRGTVADHRLARVTMVPALWTLSQRSDARVFQDVTAVEAVEAVLREAGVYVGAVEKQLQRPLPKREYCVQYRESDLDFVRRLLASEGVSFFFRHEDEAETLVLCDGAHAWEALRTMDGGAVPVAGAEGETHAVETVRHLRWERSTRPSGVAVSEFDFTRPDYRIERMAPRRREGPRNLYEPASAATLHGYAAPAYARDDAQEQAQLRLEAERLDEAVGAGEGNVSGMAPGATFRLAMAGAHVAPQRYVVTEVTHRGSAPEVLTHGDAHGSGAAAGDARYRNTFRCVPVEAPVRPKREVPRPTIAGLQTATVTGPAGEAVYTDERGRVRVQFHWDRQGLRDEHSACWVRVIQGPWAGNGWGQQFIPRVGMEVAVSFVEGDPDKPVVIGALYNGANRPTFNVPEERTRSGVRTSTVGGSGFNEWSFEDAAGREQVYLHAQRDHDERVERDHTRWVGNDERVQVDGNQTQTVHGWQQETIRGRSVRHVKADSILAVSGCASILSEDKITIESSQEIVFRCGGSMVRITPCRVEIRTSDMKVDASNTIVAASKLGGSVWLDATAKVMPPWIQVPASPVIEESSALLGIGETDSKIGPDGSGRNVSVLSAVERLHGIRFASAEAVLSPKAKKNLKDGGAKNPDDLLCLFPVIRQSWTASPSVSHILLNALVSAKVTLVHSGTITAQKRGCTQPFAFSATVSPQQIPPLENQPLPTIDAYAFEARANLGGVTQTTSVIYQAGRVAVRNAWGGDLGSTAFTVDTDGRFEARFSTRDLRRSINGFDYSVRLDVRVQIEFESTLAVASESLSLLTGWSTETSSKAIVLGAVAVVAGVAIVATDGLAIPALEAIPSFGEALALLGEALPSFSQGTNLVPL